MPSAIHGECLVPYISVQYFKEKQLFKLTTILHIQVVLIIQVIDCLFKIYHHVYIG